MELRRKQEFIAEHETFVECSVSLEFLGASLLLSLLASEWSPLLLTGWDFPGKPPRNYESNVFLYI